MSKEMELVFKEKSVEAIIKDGSVQRKKLISLTDVTQLLTNDRQTHDTGWLPGEYGVQRVIKEGSYTSYLLLEPAKLIKIKYAQSRNSEHYVDEDDYRDDDGDLDEDAYEEAVMLAEEANERAGNDRTEYDFTVPILAWMVKLKDDRRNPVKIQLYAMKSPIYTGFESMYYPPFHNIYDDCSICWGSEVQVPTQKAIQGLSSLFYGQLSNLDLAENRIQRFDRTNTTVEATGFYPIHLHSEVHEQLKAGKTAEQALSFTHNVLRQRQGTIEEKFEGFAQ